jgi:hypothetical protein
MGFNYKPDCCNDTSSIVEPAPLFTGLDPLGNSPHRYTILVYQQTQEPVVQIAPGIAGRYSFPLASFVVENKLKLVGGNFFLEQGVGGG